MIELLCSLTQSDSPALRVNGIWALMVTSKLLFHYRIHLLKKKKKKPKYGDGENSHLICTHVLNPPHDVFPEHGVPGRSEGEGGDRPVSGHRAAVPPAL